MTCGMGCFKGGYFDGCRVHDPAFRRSEIPRPAFIPADEYLEFPDDEPFPPEVQEAATAGASIHRGAGGELTRTQRMLIGLVHQGIRRRGFTQEEICRLTGLSAPYISQLLSGHRTGTFAVWDMLLEIARFDFNGLGAYTPPDTRTKAGLKRGRKPGVRADDA